MHCNTNSNTSQCAQFRWKLRSDKMVWVTHERFFMLIKSISKCGCSFHRRSTTLRSHHWHTRQLPLPESPRACLVEVGDSRISLTERHSTILSGCRSPMSSWCAVQTTPALISDPSAECPPVSVQLLETEHSPLLVLGCGTVCQKT